MNFPDDLKYTNNDEWVRVAGDIGVIGISDFAQDQLSDIVYVEINPSIGESIQKGEIFGTVESVKAASDIYMPVSGKVVEINDALLDAPETINTDPYEEGWLIKIELSDPAELDGMMDMAAYKADTEGRA